MNDATTKATETITLHAHLVALGWADPKAALRDCSVMGGGKGGPTFVLRARNPKNGGPIDLYLALPRGARIGIPGEGEGTVEYSPRAVHYVRISAEQDFDNPAAMLRDLVDVGATITR